MLLGTVAASATVSGGAPARAATVNTDPTKIAVYSFNINQMQKNWSGWIDYIAASPAPKPDIILLQDMLYTKQNTLMSALETKLSEDYEYRGGPSKNGDYHWAVIWRVARFQPVQYSSFEVFGGQSCVLGGGGADAQNVLFHDRLRYGYYVSAVSYKTTPIGTDVTCAWKNTKRVDDLSMWAGSSPLLKVLGTDANAPDRTADTSSGWTCFYKGTNGSFTSATGCDGTGNRSYFDPVYSWCGATNYSCLNNNDTKDDPNSTNDNRIDFIFAKGLNGITASLGSLDPRMPMAGTYAAPCWAVTCANAWSDHRPLRALISW